MAHFAEINASNIVQRVIVVPNSEEANGATWCANLLGGTWVQTSYNATIRKNFAGIGYTFDSVRNAFIPPKPYPSWVLNESTCRWGAPTAKPTPGEWDWDEDIEEWVEA
jgi:hypothetical protein